MNFSDEQKAIFDFAENGIQNLIVQAVAGAGKTTTLIECANRIDPGKKVMLLAHNKSTRDTLRERIGNRRNVKVYTLHGLAWRIFNERFNFAPVIDDDKYRKYVNRHLADIAADEYRNLSQPHKMIYRANLFDLINKARHNLKQSEKEIRKMAVRKYGINLMADEARVASLILSWGAENTDTVDFQDLLWLPSEKGYFTKKYLADVIMLDEAQDASIAQQDIVSRCFKRTTRLFAFGDRDQTINSWCGSDNEAFEHLKDPDTFRRDAKELPLTTNYRCGRKIIDYARKYTDNNIHAWTGAAEGEINYDVPLRNAKSGDMILCRNISPLMEVYRKGIANGQKMYFRGEELGKNLITATDCVEGESVEEIIKNLKIQAVSLWDYITETAGIDPKESVYDKRIVSLIDTIKTMENLPKTVGDRKIMNKFIKEIFSDEGLDGIQLSTVHRAKGLEADNVYIICPSLIPSKLAKMEWQKTEERHLQYVMYTRPKISLNFVSEKEIRPDIVFADGNSLFRKMHEMKEEINNK